MATFKQISQISYVQILATCCLFFSANLIISSDSSYADSRTEVGGVTFTSLTPQEVRFVMSQASTHTNDPCMAAHTANITHKIMQARKAIVAELQAKLQNDSLTQKQRAELESHLATLQHTQQQTISIPTTPINFGPNSLATEFAPTWAEGTNCNRHRPAEQTFPCKT